MLLETPSYLLFLGIVFLLFYAFEPGGPRRALLLAASYYFYFELSGIYITVLFLVTVLTYYGALALRSPKVLSRGSLFFALLICLVLVPLLVFKYLGPFLEVIGGHVLPTAFMTLALPIGVSFFTFAALGYLIDVHLEVAEPEPSFSKVALFLAFFPLVSAGPIERASFISQLDLAAKFSAKQAFAGLRLIFIGLVLKVLFAEKLEFTSNLVMDAPQHWKPIELLLGLIQYAFFIYADFAGYSLIAIGSAKLLGLEVRANFRQPFLSASIPEFWRHWHISLSSWIRDYVFAPLHMEWRRRPWLGLPAAVIISFSAIGIWHGAKWTYLMFGLIHGTLVIGSILTLPRRDAFWKSLGVSPRYLHVPRVLATFALVDLAYVTFRANSMSDAFYIYRHLFSSGMLANLHQTAFALLHHQNLPIFADLIRLKVWLFILIIIAGDILARKKWTLETYPASFQFIIYSFGLLELIATWIDIYVPHPFVYNKF
jgi:alginate O-acetyltransferase complex protein AlgI